MSFNGIVLSPSLICGNMENLQKDVKALENTGLTSLHVDLVDPHFSPSMPIGLDTIRAIRKETQMDFDVHIMSDMNEFFIQQFIDIGSSSITFHLERETHVEKMLQIIHAAGIKAGVALNPATDIQNLHYIAKECDYVLLMLINPGYANGVSEDMIPYAEEKIRDCRAFLDKYNPDAKIIVDGRVGFTVIPKLVKAGAEVLVCGSRSIFRKGHSYQENVDELNQLLNTI